jgi:hypothetical protein
VLLSRAEFAPSGVDLLKAVRAGGVGDGGSKIDREAARGAGLEKLGVPGPTGAEVGGVIAGLARDRQCVDQKEFLSMRVSFVSSFSLMLGNLGMIGLYFAQGLGCCAPACENIPQVGRRTVHVEKGGGGGQRSRVLSTYLTV